MARKKAAKRRVRVVPLYNVIAYQADRQVFTQVEGLTQDEALAQAGTLAEHPEVAAVETREAMTDA